MRISDWSSDVCSSDLLVGPADWPRVDAAAAGDAPWDEPRRSMHDPAMIVPLAAPDPYDEDEAAVAVGLAETEPERRAAFEAALAGPRPVSQPPHARSAEHPPDLQPPIRHSYAL